MHYSYLNSSYNMDVIKDWEKGGCIASVNRNLGYRLVMRELDYPETLIKEKPFHIKLTLENVGFASPYNPRNLWIVLRNQKDNKEYFIQCKADVQKWFTGKIACNENVTIPSTIPAGKYELFLNLPDKYESLSKRAEYSIRLANDNTWEEKTGYNKLNAFVTVK